MEHSSTTGSDYSPTLRTALAVKRIVWAHKDDSADLSLFAMGPPEPLGNNTANTYSFDIRGNLGSFLVTVTQVQS